MQKTFRPKRATSIAALIHGRNDPGGVEVQLVVAVKIDAILRSSACEGVHR